MGEINAALVRELREETNLGMMECKRALQDANGDKPKAIRILRERGVAFAHKKAARATNQGLIAAAMHDGGRAGSLIEVNCETDFVARNEGFQSFVRKLAEKAATADGNLADLCKDEITAKIAETGENIVARRNVRYVLQGTGIVASYIHPGAKIGVLIEVGCAKPETAQNDAFRETVKELLLHIAACNPRYLVPEEIPADVIEAERQIYATQFQNKPANVVDKIVGGKIQKFYADVCLVRQGFVKDPDQSVTKFIEGKSKELADTITIRRFTRYQLGE